MSKLKAAPSVLAFERKINNSDGIMYSGLWENRRNPKLWAPIALKEKTVRGTTSHRLEQKDRNDPLKVEAKIENANIQTIDVAAIPFDSDTLKVEFSLRFLGEVFRPTACNNTEYQNKLESTIKSYLEKFKCEELSKRYAESIASGRFLWRNRLCADKVEVVVTLFENNSAQESFTFDALGFDLNKFSKNNSADLEKLARFIQRGLTGEKSTFFKVEAFAQVGYGQEVYPSQEFIQKEKSQSKQNGEKSKILYSLGDQAALHSQKIGNALRTIDTWHSEASEYGPIAIEIYGSVTNKGVALRQSSKKMDFYSLFDSWICKDIEPSPEQQHYVVGCLIRGGVFGEKVKSE